MRGFPQAAPRPLPSGFCALLGREGVGEATNRSARVAGEAGGRGGPSLFLSASCGCGCPCHPAMLLTRRGRCVPSAAVASCAASPACTEPASSPSPSPSSAPMGHCPPLGSGAQPRGPVDSSVCRAEPLPLLSWLGREPFPAVASSMIPGVPVLASQYSET